MSATRSQYSASDFLPQQRSMSAARRAAASCKGCPLWQNATQTVFGEGLRGARLMFVGEMPGDQEDTAGKPFVGPAGRLLDRAMQAAGLDRDAAYITNVVKHFKWTPRGRRRLHRTPNTSEVGACLPWLEMEIDLIRPEALVCLGATASRALLGRGFLLTRERGHFVSSPLAPFVTATIHPSALLRLRDAAERETEMQRFVADLELVGQTLK